MYDGLQVFILALDDLTGSAHDLRATWLAVSSGDERTPIPPGAQTNDFAQRRTHRTYVGRLERGESGVTVEALAAILAALSVSLGEFFKPFKDVVRPRTPRRRG